MGSVQCDMTAEEDCALDEHETVNIVCCAKHGLELPCDECLGKEKAVKEALSKDDKKDKGKNDKGGDKSAGTVEDQEMAE